MYPLASTDPPGLTFLYIRGIRLWGTTGNRWTGSPRNAFTAPHDFRDVYHSKS